MQVTSTLNIPDELERARGAGELVVFAGAGVSTGPPANLPSFLELAREIADPSIPLKPEHHDSLDRYLGRAERDADVRVQERARAKLLERGGSYTSLHRHLVGLFGTPDRVRLITTNFDTLFTDASDAEFNGVPIPHYVGPALPPGRDFRGIAHIHASLIVEHDRLVLTDRDFGTAYMTDGWAARFLVGVFENRTILFVGYRMGDPVLQYLISALRRTERWYTLCPIAEQPHWADSDVSTIPFKPHGENEFADLNEGLERWYWHASASVRDHEKELRDLIRQGPPASPVDADYVRERLATEQGRITFWTDATDPQWFAWAVDEKLVDPSFDEKNDSGETVGWARWCISNFCDTENPPFLQFCRKRSLQLSSTFAFHLALHLHHAGSLPQRPVLRQLVSLLVNQSSRRRSASIDPYVWLLEKMVSAKYTEESLAILRWLTRIRLEPPDHIQLKYEANNDQLTPLASGVTIAASADDVNRVLEKHGSTLADIAANDLVALGEQRILEAYDLLDLARGGKEGGVDWLSHRRTSIPPSGQDRFAGAENVLVELIRLGMDSWQAKSPASLEAFANKHKDNPRRLLKRFALYALAICGPDKSDKVLTMAAAEHWASDFQVRPELYHLLKQHYDLAKESTRRQFIATLRDESLWGEFDEHQAHARFSLSKHLLRLSPTSDVTRDFTSEEEKSHPEWREQDRDGLLTRVEVGRGGFGKSPIEPDQMVKWDPTEALVLINNTLKQANTDDREALRGAVMQAVRTNGEWGARLLSVVATGQSEAPSNLIKSIIYGLRDASCEATDQLSALQSVGLWDWPSEVTHSLSQLVEHWARDVKDIGDCALFEAFDNVADRLFERSEIAESGILGEAGWTERAINHPAGNAALTWRYAANARDWIDGQFVLTIDDDELSRWERVLHDETAAGAHARVILGMVSDRLSNGNYPWSEENLFPAFDPDADLDRAAQLWDGRLMQTQWSWTTIAGLRPYLRGLFESCSQLIPARSHQLGDWVAMLVAHPSDSQFGLRDLQQFVHHSMADARRAFANAMPRHLSQLSAGEREKLWNEVLRPYWRDRRTNVPVAFEPEEVTAMIGWVTAMPEVTTEAVAELIQTSGRDLQHADHILWTWKQDDAWVRGHPSEATALIKWLAEGRSIESWRAPDAVKHLEAALKAGAPSPEVIAATEALATLPCPDAIAFLGQLEKDVPEGP